jgi:hypothetical protein
MYIYALNPTVRFPLVPFTKHTSMLKKLLSLAAFSFLFLQISTGQVYLSKLKLDVGLNMGGSVLMHQTRFEESRLRDAYKYAADLFAKHDMEYTWDQFAADHKLRESFAQPRIGFSALITYDRLPFYIMAEYMSSTSSYQKMSISATIGMSQDFFLPSEEDYFGVKGGYKFVVRDFGFGSQTLVNSIGDDQLRKDLAVFYDPKQPLGAPSGRLFASQLSYGHVFADGNFTAGADVFGELDLTPVISRESRMTNFGIECFIRFRLMGKAKVWNDEVFSRSKYR